MTTAQLLRADRQCFIRTSENFTGSLKSPSLAGKPLDPLIEKLESDVSVTYFMLPHASSQSSKEPASSSTDGAKRKQQVSKPVDSSKYSKKGGKSSGKAKAKARDPMPAALQGMHSQTPKGLPICFAYNFGSCKAGAKCTREHVCCVPGCYKQHPHLEHQ